MKPVNVNETSFSKEVLESDVPVLVDFWAPWCAPCRMVAPVLEELAREYNGMVKIVKLNTDENQALAMKYNIMSIPSLLIFKNGEVVDQVVGAVPKQTIAAKLNYYGQGAAVLN